MLSSSLAQQSSGDGEHGGAAGMITRIAACASNMQIVLHILSTRQGAAGVLNDCCANKSAAWHRCKRLICAAAKLSYKGAAPKQPVAWLTVCSGLRLGRVCSRVTRNVGEVPRVLYIPQYYYNTKIRKSRKVLAGAVEASGLVW